jgi:hypothetical protein
MLPQLAPGYFLTAHVVGCVGLLTEFEAGSRGVAAFRGQKKEEENAAFTVDDGGREIV